MVRRHQHIWKVEGKVTQQSAWEQLNAKAAVKHADRLTPELFNTPVVVTYKCSICGSEKVERV